MTPKQRECLDFVDAFIARTGWSPSYDEIREALGLATKSCVFRLVHGLRKAGHIRLAPYDRRSIELTNPRSQLAAYTTEALQAELARRAEAVARG